MKYSSEILTGLSIGGVIASDALFVRATKLEQMDGDKKHYILPSVVSAATIAAIICSYRISRKQKLALIGAVGAMSARCVEARKIMNPERQEVMDELLIEAEAAKYNDETELDKELFYLPDYGIIFKADRDDVREAEFLCNRYYTHNGACSLSEFLEAAGIDDDLLLKQTTNEILKFDYGDGFQYDFQYIQFDHVTRKLTCGKKCTYIYINKEAVNMKWEDE